MKNCIEPQLLQTKSHMHFIHGNQKIELFLLHIIEYILYISFCA